MLPGSRSTEETGCGGAPRHEKADYNYPALDHREVKHKRLDYLFLNACRNVSVCSCEKGHRCDSMLNTVAVLRSKSHKFHVLSLTGGVVLPWSQTVFDRTFKNNHCGSTGGKTMQIMQI